MTTEADLTASLADYLAAEKAILTGAQEYTVGSGSTARKMVRADLALIQKGIASLRAQISTLYPAKPVRRISYLRPRR